MNIKKALSAPTIIIVEDDEAVRESLEALLETSGYGVRSFASLGDFLTADVHEGICLLIDLHHGSESAASLAARLEARAWPQPTLIVSGAMDIVSKGKALAAGAYAVLDTPLDPDELLALVEQTASTAGA